MQTSPELLEDEVGYRQVSPAAVVALALGLSSLVAFVGPAFFLAPAAAIGVALLALGKIRRSGGALTGEGLARLGLALALACMAGALVRGSVRDALMQRQAVETARQWLDLLASGRMKDARELLSADGASALLPPRQMGPPSTDEAAAEAIILDKLRSEPVTHAASEAKGAISLDEATEPIFDGGRAVVGTTFTLGGATGDAHRHVTLQLSRIARYELEGRPWRIDRWNLQGAHANHP
ncbi:MAG: hypothetical protein IT424_03675 [Pirellulales bacterium]|nr:hypothetical protein [Pirellulales bacterium]